MTEAVGLPPNEGESESDPLEISVLLLEIVRALVDAPAQVSVREVQQDRLLITVDPADVGKVLGKAGSTIKALTELFSKIAAVEGRKVSIDIFDPRKNMENSAPRRRSRV